MKSNWPSVPVYPKHSVLVSLSYTQMVSDGLGVWSHKRIHFTREVFRGVLWDVLDGLKANSEIWLT